MISESFWRALYHDPELTHTSSRDFYHMAWA
jgi:hypothetical protein